jgi:hypothetical protein
LKEEALDRTPWKNLCGRGYGPVELRNDGGGGGDGGSGDGSQFLSITALKGFIILEIGLEMGELCRV